MSTEISAVVPAPDPTLVRPPIPSDRRIVEIWGHGLAARTVRAYLRAVVEFAEVVGRPFDEIEIEHVQEYADVLARRGLAPNTRAQKLAAIKSLLTFSNKHGYIRRNVGTAVRLPRRPDTLTARIVDEGTMRAVLDGETDPPRRLFMRLAYSTGARVSELVAIRWSDCHGHGEGGVVSISEAKGGTPRNVRVPAAVWRELWSRRPAATAEAGQEDPYVFSSTRRPGTHVDASTVTRWVRAAGRRVGIERLSPHWMRHAHASHALDRQAPIHLVAATLGHRSIATTTRYSHARPGESSGDYLDLGAADGDTEAAGGSRPR